MTFIHHKTATAADRYGKGRTKSLRPPFQSNLWTYFYWYII